MIITKQICEISDVRSKKVLLMFFGVWFGIFLQPCFYLLGPYLIPLLPNKQLD